jgi:hypothetical protein
MTSADRQITDNNNNNNDSKSYYNKPLYKCPAISCIRQTRDATKVYGFSIERTCPYARLNLCTLSDGRRRYNRESKKNITDITET